MSGRAARTVVLRTGSLTARFRTFRKHRRPCGQPAVGETGRFRPVPPHAGHFSRINATPSDFPFRSTGFAIYPVPPQFGQSSESTPLPLTVEDIVYDNCAKFSVECFTLRIPNKLADLNSTEIEIFVSEARGVAVLPSLPSTPAYV